MCALQVSCASAKFAEIVFISLISHNNEKTNVTHPYLPRKKLKQGKVQQNGRCWAKDGNPNPKSKEEKCIHINILICPISIHRFSQKIQYSFCHLDIQNIALKRRLSYPDRISSHSPPIYWIVCMCSWMDGCRTCYFLMTNKEPDAFYEFTYMDIHSRKKRMEED